MAQWDLSLFCKAHCVAAHHWRDKWAMQKILPTGGFTLSMDFKETGVAGCELQSNKALANSSSQIAPNCHHWGSLLMCPSSFEECNKERRLAESQTRKSECFTFPSITISGVDKAFDCLWTAIENSATSSNLAKGLQWSSTPLPLALKFKGFPRHLKGLCCRYLGGKKGLRFGF